MARVTVEDCVQVIPNRYELVLVAAQRARDISAGSPITIDRDNDKNPVVALREVADQTINLEEVRKHIATGVNRMSDLNQEDDMLLAIAATGAEEQPTATAVAIEDVVFDASASLAAAEEDFGGEDGFEGPISGEDMELGVSADVTADFGGDAGFAEDAK